MKILCSLILLFPSIAFGQLSEPIFFREKSFDFGEVREEEGVVMHEFQFTNLSGREIKIVSVQASCGCTTSGWTKDPIGNGETGYVRANFDPKGRPGYFSKTLTVVTDLDGTPIVLLIKGNVSTGSNNDPEQWPAAYGNLRLRTNSFNLGKQYINKEPASMSFSILNSGKKTINILKNHNPNYLKVQYPNEIGPGQTGKVSITLDAKMKGQYGFLMESVDLETDDDEMPRKTISVYATVEENFDSLTPDYLKNAPALGLEVSTVELGSLKRESEIPGEVMIRNVGKRELTIRSIQSNCSCLQADVDAKNLKENGQVLLKFRLKTPAQKGPIQKAITLYSNDPKNPVQRITITGLVN